MKKLPVLLLLCVFAAAFRVNATEVSGSITANTVWSGTVHVTGDVVITDGILTIKPETRVIFSPVNDNPVYGDSTHIWLVVSDSGAIDARGNDWQRISFSSVEQRPGAWGGIRFAGLKNDAGNHLIHCDVAYAVDGISVENPMGADEPSSPSVTYCEISHCARYGVYGNKGASPIIKSCMIHDAVTGVFLHEASDVTIVDTYLFNLATGLVVSGGSSVYGDITLNHVTVNNISAAYDSLPVWWYGYALYCTNTGGRLTVTNSIIADTEHAIKLNNWEFTGSCNYWCADEVELPDSLYDTGSLSCGTAPVLFENAGEGDFRLLPASRAVYAACDSRNMGAWQDWHDWPYQNTTGGLDNVRPERAGAVNELLAAPNPFRTDVLLTIAADMGGSLGIHDRNGRIIRKLTVPDGSLSVSWDGRNDAGVRVAPGMYVCRMVSGGTVIEKTLIMVR